MTAKQNARRNGVGNCRFFAGDVAAMVTQVRQSQPQIDLIVLNPPRRGVQPAALETMLAVNAPRIIYVSCEPTSLARDLVWFAHAGYGVSCIQPFDMFPQAEDVEALDVVEDGHSSDALQSARRAALRPA